mmetsp:Transcript_35449/g.75556  ORF Transcript_35449/g.75556 Transcript_35449/m.75556 type:complete len:231 (+) Transcript_35449:514-1206(+)
MISNMEWRVPRSVHVPARDNERVFMLLLDRNPRTLDNLRDKKKEKDGKPRSMDNLFLFLKQRLSEARAGAAAALTEGAIAFDHRELIARFHTNSNQCRGTCRHHRSTDLRTGCPCSYSLPIPSLALAGPAAPPRAPSAWLSRVCSLLVVRISRRQSATARAGCAQAVLTGASAFAHGGFPRRVAKKNVSSGIYKLETSYRRCRWVLHGFDIHLTLGLEVVDQRLQSISFA